MIAFTLVLLLIIIYSETGSAIDSAAVVDGLNEETPVGEVDDTFVGISV